MLFNSLLAITLVVTSFAIALASLLSFSFFGRRRRHRFQELALADRNVVVFLFENENLLDASPEARRIMATGPKNGTDWAHFSGLLHPRFPGLADRIKDLADLGKMALASQDGTSRIDAVWHDGVARLTLIDEETAEPNVELDRHSMHALQKELETLRATAERVPYLTWRENPQGDIIWANRAYLELAEVMTPSKDAPPWPPARLFDRVHNAGDAQRVALSLPDDEVRRWFDIYETRLGEDMLLSAISADAVVSAEKSRSEFVTTLTKTFADLSIGLAIFDRSRQLALFNPALTDLTDLPAAFLCAYPSLFSFLDQLREKRMMPEPKDYKSWRQQMSALEAKAVDGTYEETWPLPTGQTYRVTGRPHPDGAVAFLFEDISSEISLTRRFRAELEMGQAALDVQDTAIAVFSPAGILSMSNTAYAQLWGTDPSSELNDINISEAAHRWHHACNPSLVWEKLRTFVRTAGERSEWSATLSLKDGRPLLCRAVPMAQGATLVSFQTYDASINVKPPHPADLATAEA